MKSALLSVLAALSLAAAAAAREDQSGRISGLEVRVVKVEKRVDRLESAGSVRKPSPANPKEPVTAVFLKKEPVSGLRRMGIRLYIELENTAERPFEGFGGRIIFRDGEGTALYSREYSRAERFESGDRITLAVMVSAANAKAYLKVLRAKTITVDFTGQKFYEAAVPR